MTCSFLTFLLLPQNLLTSEWVLQSIFFVNSCFFFISCFFDLYIDNLHLCCLQYFHFTAYFCTKYCNDILLILITYGCFAKSTCILLFKCIFWVLKLLKILFEQFSLCPFIVNSTILLGSLSALLTWVLGSLFFVPFLHLLTIVYRSEFILYVLIS